MFELDNHQVTISNLNTRTEKHGPKDIPAITLTLKTEIPNYKLNDFANGLLQAMYDRASDREEQASMGFEEDFFPELKFRNFKPIQLTEEFPGRRIDFLSELEEGKIRETIYDCRLSDFVLEMKDGGTVAVSFKAHGKPDEETGISYLYTHQMSTVPVRLTVNESDGPVQQDIVEIDEAEREKFAQEAAEREKAEQELENAFSQE